VPEIIYTDSYNKRAGKFLKKHPELLGQYERTLRLLEVNPLHPSLKLHKLQGRLSDMHSVSINITYRISIFFIFENNQIVPIDVGTHDQVY
jgi:proteic killer suppression protein